MASTAGGFVVCPHCGDTEVKFGSRFCDSCGKEMLKSEASVKGVCPKCAGGEFDADGFCQDCGTHTPQGRLRMPAVVCGDGLAGLTDVGKLHSRNDDAFDVEGPPTGGPGTVIALCDGVSNSQASDIASAAAVRVARQVLAQALSVGADMRKATVEAIRQAHGAVCSVPFNRNSEVDPPAATIVTAVVMPFTEGKVRVVTGWLGDSRLYWLSPDGSGRLITRDHSWCNSEVDAGRLTPEEAWKHKLAHAITKCLGSADFDFATPCPEPSVEVVELPAQGWLLACSDGLWNYAMTPEGLILAANGKLWTSSAEDVARQFVQFALGRGGMDNITCVLSRLG